MTLKSIYSHLKETAKKMNKDIDQSKTNESKKSNRQKKVILANF